MDYIKKMDSEEQDALYGELLNIKNKLEVFRFLDPEMTQDKELIFGIKEISQELGKQVETCIRITDEAISQGEVN